MNDSHLVAGAELMARIDVTAICSSLALAVGGATRGDIHLFAYLSSMANTQAGLSPSAWGYQFAATENGLPFAEALDFAADRMVASGELMDSPDGLTPSVQLREIFENVASGHSFGSRVSLIRDVCSVAVYRALPGIGRAVRGEDQLKRSQRVGSVRLIDELELARSLTQLTLSVRDQLPPQYPPSSPAMLWLDQWEREHAG